MKSIIKEVVLLMAAFAPLVVLAYLYTDMPATVPTHWGFNGPDAWGSKSQLIYVPGLMGPGLYLLTFFLPRLDPKGRITQMGEKWFALRLLLQLFFAAIGLYILHETTSNSQDMGSFLMVLFGVFFSAMGNYFQTIRPNYFLGIRTPWTLESEQVWRDTHLLGGRLWMIGGLLILPLYFVTNQYFQAAAFISAVIILALVPIVYSYFRYKSLTRKAE